MCCEDLDDIVLTKLLLTIIFYAIYGPLIYMSRFMLIPMIPLGLILGHISINYSELFQRNINIGICILLSVLIIFNMGYIICVLPKDSYTYTISCFIGFSYLCSSVYHGIKSRTVKIERESDDDSDYDEYKNTHILTYMYVLTDTSDSGDGWNYQ